MQVFRRLFFAFPRFYVLLSFGCLDVCVVGWVCQVTVWLVGFSKRRVGISKRRVEFSKRRVEISTRRVGFSIRRVGETFGRADFACCWGCCDGVFFV